MQCGRGTREERRLGSDLRTMGFGAEDGSQVALGASFLSSSCLEPGPWRGAVGANTQPHGYVRRRGGGLAAAGAVCG